MSKKIQSIITVVLVSVIILGMMIWCIVTPKNSYSEAERRKLEQFPTVSVSNILSGNFMSKFENYAADQFPMRETFRGINAKFNFGIMRKKDVNDIYIVGRYIGKLEPVINQKSVDWGVSRFQLIIDKYLDENNKVYFAPIPDKNYYLSEANGYPYLDYEKLVNSYVSGVKADMKLIDLTGALSLESYYYTDTHWSQDKILPVVKKLGQGLGVSFKENYSSNAIDNPFYGVYYGQAALVLEPDEIKYLTSDEMKDYKVYCYDTGKPVEMSLYDMKAAGGRDPYEMFLEGSKSLITIENPNAENKGSLVVFRDSFGSSISPLLASGYSKITVVDIRYISPSNLQNYVEFEGADVLFMYSVSVLNNTVGQFLK